LGEPNEKQDEKTSVEQEDTSKQEPETFTKETQAKAISDALAAAGRTTKDTDTKLKKATEAASKAEKLMVDMKAERERKAEQDYQDALKKADGDPITIRNIKLAREVKTLTDELGTKKSELGKRDEELTETRKEAALSTKERNAREIASKYEVDLETLKLTDGSVEAMEALAKTLSGKGIKTLKPDGSKTSGGGGGIPTDMGQFRNWVANLSQSEFEERSEEINKMMKQGKIK